MSALAKIGYIMHAYHDTIHLQLGDLWYHVPPLDPFLIEDGQFYIDKLLEIYGPVYGIIQIETEQTRTGVSINADAAEKLARAALDSAELSMLSAYINAQQTERLAHGLPPMPPSGRVDEIIRRRKIDLKAKYNLVIPGRDGFVDTEKEALRSENQKLKAQVAGHEATLDTIMERLDAMEKAKSGSTTK